MDLEKYKDKGLSGLANLGNTCFLNSTMQVISHTYELNTFLDTYNFKVKLNNKHDSILLIEWDNLRKILWKENCIVSPNKFVETVQKIALIKGQELFTGYNQNDLPEFLIFLIDCFHNALARQVNMCIEGVVKEEKDKVAVKCYETIKNMYEKDYSEIWNLFYGIHVSVIEKKDTDEIISLIPEPYFIVSLPIPSNNKTPNLLDCFNLYVEKEILEEENRIIDEKTGEKICINKKIMFWSFPTILVIDLKRFNAGNHKNQIMVDFPIENLDLSEYIIGYNKNTFVYDLYAVCNHSGSVLGGHYTSFVKNANGKWYHYNDTSVSEVSLDQQIKTPKAYCFFYRKKAIKNS